MSRFALSLLVSSLIPPPQSAPAPAPAPAPDWSGRIEWSDPDGPAAREHAAFVPDTDRGRAVLLTGSGYEPYGSPLGDAWSLDLATDTWTQLELVGDGLTPGGSQRAARCTGGAFLHGGYGAGLTPLDGLWRVEFADDLLAVERIEQENPPPARLLHAFACDLEGEHFVVFGGATQEQEMDDTWLGRHTPEGVRWERLEDDFNPGPRFGFAFAHDPAEKRLLVCGGQVPPDSPDAGFVTAHDLWALDFSAKSPIWTLLAEYDPDVFPGRRNPAFAFDDASGDLFIWGGTGNGTSALPDLYVVRTRVEGAPVQRVPQPESIPTRASGFGVVDGARDRALLGFGNNAMGRFQDLAEISLRPGARPQPDTRSD